MSQSDRGAVWFVADAEGFTLDQRQALQISALMIALAAPTSRA